MLCFVSRNSAFTRGESHPSAEDDMVITETSAASRTSPVSVTGRGSGLSGVLHKGSTAGTSSTHLSKTVLHKDQQQQRTYHRKHSPHRQHQHAGGVCSSSSIVNNKISSSSASSQPSSRRPASSPSIGRHQFSDSSSSGVLSSSTATSHSRTDSNTGGELNQSPFFHKHHQQQTQNNNTTTSNSTKNTNRTDAKEDSTGNHCNCRNQLQRSNSERPSSFSPRQQDEENVQHSPKLQQSQYQFITHKYPLTRNISNITVDSGRSSTSGTDDCIFDEEDEDFVDNSVTNRITSLTSAADTVTSRRHSIACVDSTGHLDVPAYPCLDPLLVSASPAATHSQQRLRSRNCSDPGNSPDDALGDQAEDYEAAALCPPGSASASDASPNSSSSPVNVLSVRRAPKIVYSHSEDRLTASCNGQQRPIIPSLPYSPYGSPTASPRLKRQPTMETHRVSVSEGTGSYTQLNQYTLQDEIGKVCGTLTQVLPFISSSGFMFCGAVKRLLRFRWNPLQKIFRLSFECSIEIYYLCSRQFTTSFVPF